MDKRRKKDVTQPVVCNDVMVDILLRLPAKSLGRFKSVCKWWNSLISSRGFVLRHMDHSLSTLSNLHLAFVTYGWDYPSILYTMDLPTPYCSPPKALTLPFSSAGPCFQVIGSCHGLVCINDNFHYIALYSPTTKTYHVIPLHDRPVLAPGEVPRAATVNVKDVAFGFGYDPISDDYVVVRLDQPYGFRVGQELPRVVVRVYKLKEGKWRKVNTDDEDFPAFCIPSFSIRKDPGVMLNNSLHWLASCDDTNNSKGYIQFIVAFDICTERFSAIEIPFAYYSARCVSFGPFINVVWGQNLVVEFNCGDGTYGDHDQSNWVDVWLMKEYGVKESWVRLYSFPVPLKKKKVSPYMICRQTSKRYGRKHMAFIDQAKLEFWSDLHKFRVSDDCNSYCFPLEPFSWLRTSRFETVLLVDTIVHLNNVGLEHTEVEWPGTLFYNDDPDNRRAGMPKAWIQRDGAMMSFE